MPPCCCICSRKNKSGRWYKRDDYEVDFATCFGTDRDVNSHTRDLCCSCQTDITRYRKTGKRNLNKVNTKGKKGKPGHSSIGGIRKKSSPDVYVNPPRTVSTLVSCSVNTDVTGTDVDVYLRDSQNLTNLRNVNKDNMLSTDQEKLYTAMTKHKLTYAKHGKERHDGNIVFARNSKGPPIKMQKITEPRKKTGEISSRTQSERNRQSKDYERLISCPASSSEEDVEESILLQRAAQMKTDRSRWLQAMDKAGFKVHGMFTRESVMSMRSQMPMTLFKKLKRIFKTQIGFNVLGSEDTLYKELTDIEVKYEGATFIGDGKGNRKVSVIRVANVADVVVKTVNELVHANLIEPLSNLEPGQLWLHASADKGGQSTKLVLQVLNSKNRHSIKAAKLLAMFEGDKDSRHNIAVAFGPVLEELRQVAESIEGLQIRCPTFPSSDRTIHDDTDVNPADLGFEPLQPLNHSNLHISKHCRHCTKILDNNAKPVDDAVANPSSDHMASYQTCKLTYGGDWEVIAVLVGISKPSCTYFCPHCLVSSDLLQKGVPHFLPNDDDVDNQDGSDELRTLEGNVTNNQRYIDETGGDKLKAKHYSNCINPPLIGESGQIIDIVSTSPMHVSLGLGLKNVNIIEEVALGLDGEVKGLNGIHCDIVKDKYRQKNQLLLNIRNKEEQLARLQQEKEEANTLMEELKQENRRLHKDRINNLKEEMKDIDVFSDYIKKSKSELNKNVEKLITEISEISGPFGQRFTNVLDGMALKRQVYHSGALIGNDVKKTLLPENIAKLANVFQPLDLETDEGMKTFSSEEYVNKVRNLLTKFAACYFLYHRNDVLCKHEVELLAYHCTEFGKWFPIAFPTHSLIRKFHLLTYEIPRQARRSKTVGMMMEHVAESIHPYMNKTAYMFAQTQDPIKRQMLMARQFNIFGHSSIS